MGAPQRQLFVQLLFWKGRSLASAVGGFVYKLLSCCCVGPVWLTHLRKLTDFRLQLKEAFSMEVFICCMCQWGWNACLDICFFFFLFSLQLYCCGAYQQPTYYSWKIWDIFHLWKWRRNSKSDIPTWWTRSFISNFLILICVTLGTSLHPNCVTWELEQYTAFTYF